MAQVTALFVVEEKMRIKFADFVFEINNKFEYIENQCKAYLTDEEQIDLFIECSDTEIEAERGATGVDYPAGYLESLAVYRKICSYASEHGAILVHSAVIEVDGGAYAFLAKSGTGKSTHIALWRRALGDRVQIINGDKPIYRLIDGTFYAYGTPWCGKEGWNRNVRAPIKALCYIERAEKNSTTKISPSDSALRFMGQLFLPSTADGVSSALALADKLLTSVDSYIIRCNISDEAALLAYNTIVEGEKK